MENKDDMDTIARLVRENHGLPKVRLTLQMKRGYHLLAPRSSFEGRKMPEEFVQIDEGSKVCRFTVDELDKLNVLYQETLQEVWYLTECELGSLLNEILHSDNLRALHQLCDSMALLDFLSSFVTYLSFSKVAVKRPRLSETGPIALKRAHHPILLHLGEEKSVPNSVFLDESSCLHIITGRNQSGKSTFIRMVGTIIILAQTGCFIPAQYACLRVIKRIVTRMNNNDDISQMESHYSKEMRDVVTIIEAVEVRNLKKRRSRTPSENPDRTLPNTLVLIDELGRATSTTSGFSMAYAVAENLSKRPRVLTLFTTHYLGLGALARVNPAIQSFHLQAILQDKEGDDDDNFPMPTTRDEDQRDVNVNVKFTYQVQDGVLTETAYGIETARMAGFPKTVAKEAERIRSQIPAQRIHTADDVMQNVMSITTEDVAELRRQRKTVRVHQRISIIKSLDKTPEEEHCLLAKLHAEVVRHKARDGGEEQSATELRTSRESGDGADDDEITPQPEVGEDGGSAQIP